MTFGRAPGSSQETPWGPRMPRKLQAAPDDPTKPQEATEGFRKLEGPPGKLPGGPRRPPGGSRRPPGANCLITKTAKCFVLHHLMRKYANCSIQQAGARRSQEVSAAGAMRRQEEPENPGVPGKSRRMRMMQSEPGRARRGQKRIQKREGSTRRRQQEFPGH
jgi:hypothetical protein